MKILKVNSLTNILVDDEDFDRLSSFSYYLVRGHPRRLSHTVKDKTYAMGRQQIVVSLANDVMNKYDILFDHKDRNPLNNQKNNLREATYQQNARNRTKQKYSSSQYKGVFFRNDTKKWRVILCVDGKNQTVGQFVDEQEAAMAYDKRAKELFGEFAVLNFPNAQ